VRARGHAGLDPRLQADAGAPGGNRLASGARCAPRAVAGSAVVDAAPRRSVPWGSAISHPGRGARPTQLASCSQAVEGPQGPEGGRGAPVRFGTSVAFLLAVLVAPRALAVPIRWSAVGNGAWNTAGNWSTGQVPTAADDVTVDTAVTITIANPANGA